jgi:hypothetical protein
MLLEAITYVTRRWFTASVLKRSPGTDLARGLPVAGPAAAHGGFGSGLVDRATDVARATVDRCSTVEAVLKPGDTGPPTLVRYINMLRSVLDGAHSNCVHRGL